MNSMQASLFTAFADTATDTLVPNKGPLPSAEGMPRIVVASFNLARFTR